MKPDDHDKNKIKDLKKKAIRRGIAKSADGTGGCDRHVIFCTGDSCCKGDTGKETFKFLGKRLNELAKAGGPVIYRTQTNCLQVCKNGPLMVVYPDGIWYGDLSPEVCERIVEEHFVGNVPVADYVFADSPLLVGETK